MLEQPICIFKRPHIPGSAMATGTVLLYAPNTANHRLNM